MIICDKDGLENAIKLLGSIFDLIMVGHPPPVKTTSGIENARI